MAQDKFESTQWSVVLAAGNQQTVVSRQALATLCETYWPALYAYIRRRGYPVEDAQDLTQEFLTRFLEHNSLQNVSPDKGLFRSYLLASVKHFLANEWDKATAQKRGGGRIPLSLDSTRAEEIALQACAGILTPEKMFDRRWALATLESALIQLEASYRDKGKHEVFEALKDHLTGAQDGQTYKDIAERLGISETGVKSAAHRIRKRYQEALRAEVAQAVDSEEDVSEEIRHLISALSG